MHAEIDELQASIAKLTEEISELTKAIAELDAAMAKELMGAFEKVKKTIQNMVDVLTQEKEDEIKHKDFCIDELNQNDRDTDSKNRDKDDIVAKIEGLTM